jgi:predicted kinase
MDGSICYCIIIRGPPGSGKSSVAERLSKLIKANMISVDSVLKINGLEEDMEGGYISQSSFIKANAIIAADAERSLKSGVCVIIDGNFYWPSQIVDLSGRLGEWRIYAFTMKVPLSVCITRDSLRKQPLGREATEAVYKKTVSFNYGIDIDASGSIDDTANAIISYLPSG